MWNFSEWDVAAVELQINHSSDCCLVVPRSESQWAEFHGPNANARHNSVLHNTNTQRSGLDQNAISLLWSCGHRIYSVTSSHIMLGEPSAAQSERFGLLLMWLERHQKNTSFNFLYTSLTSRHRPSSHVRAVCFLAPFAETSRPQVWMAASFLHGETNRVHAPLVSEHLQLCWAGGNFITEA